MKKFLSIMRLIVMILVLLVIVTTICVIASAKDKNEIIEKAGFIFIGDSRTVDMNNVVHMDSMDDIFVVAENNAGYEWYMKEGSSLVYDIRTAHPECTNWIYIFNLGINDLGNIESYKNLYRELSFEATVYYESINPTNDEVSDIKCDDIYEFNKALRYAMPDEDYINTYDYLLRVSGYEFPKKKDGVHYDEATYENIYDFIMMAIEVHEFVRKNDGRYSAYYYLYNAK